MLQHRSSLSLLLASWSALLAPAVLAQENVNSTQQPLTTEKGITLWTTEGNVVPVCWETPGYAREKQISREAVSGSWELYAHIRFTGWDDCPRAGVARQVRIRVHAQGSENMGAGGRARLGTAALSSADENNPGVNLSFNPDGSADEGRVEYIAVHELGHVLGFIHEQDAPGNEGPGRCTEGLDPNAHPIAITGYDPDSVMNYCNRDGNTTGYLTDADIEGVQRAYGRRRPNAPPLNACSSARDVGIASLGAAWNNAGALSIAVFPSDGTQFLYHSQRSHDGGWADDIKWASGDFDGDGQADVAGAWNNGGRSTLTLRLGTGSSFTHVHWLVNAGAWSETSKLLSGDFNADGLNDLASVWNDGGKASITVYLSDGTKFLAPSQWSVQDGGWGDNVKWTAGDFDGDGAADIGAAWNNGGATVLTVRLARGGSFTHEHWNGDAGRWFNSSTFLAGDFNGDGLADLAELWNDLGRNSIKVALSSGGGFFRPFTWARRDGGLPDGTKWVPGDFNGDGQTDIAAIWNYGGTNTLTVRASTGASFTAAHWSTNGGGWMPTTAWCSGAF